MTADDAFDDLESIFGAAREERRAEEEEYARAALRQWARHRDLLDVVRELQHRGDTISLRVGDVVLVGTIDAVGRDYVQLRTDGGRVDVRLTSSAHDGASAPVLLRVVRRARRGGRRAEADAATFRARLLEYDGDEIEAVVGVTIGDELRGCVVVGRDHLVVRDRDGSETYVPLGNVAWVRPWRE